MSADRYTQDLELLGGPVEPPRARGMTTGEALTLADEWRRRGVPVFPVAISWDADKGGTHKEPRAAGHGFLDATTDERAMRLLFNKADPGNGATLGVGLRPGPAGLMFVDVDGTGSVEQYEARDLPASYTVTTCSGARHYVYRKAADVNVGTSCEWPEVDVVRADDGFVVAPGTFTPWGEWVSHDDFSSDIIVAPDELWSAIDQGGSNGSSGTVAVSGRGLDAIVARLAADGRDQDAEALRLLCQRYGGHHPFMKGDEVHVTRPGKTAGTSATVGYSAPGVVKLFTGNWPPFDSGGRYVVTGDALVDSDRLERLIATAEDSASPADDGAQPFPVLRIGEMARLVDAAPAPRFVVRRLLVEGDYGVLGATMKFGKTWIVTDLGVNVAAGGLFLGGYPVDVDGPVLVFAGEGGRRKIVRRARAVAAWYGHDLDVLPLYVHERAPKLADIDQVQRLAATVAVVRPVLVIVDPGYLAIAGADTPNLASMGVLLERAQHVVQDAGAALLFSHHWNKTGAGSGADRFTGSGWAEWGRVLLSGSRLSLNTDVQTGATTAICKLEITGDEIADTATTFRRRVWVGDPDDLRSPMHYEVELVDVFNHAENVTFEDAAPGLKPAAARVLAVLRAVPDRWFDHVEIGDRLADDGHPLKKRTILEAGQALVESALAEDSGGVGAIRKTFRAHPVGGNAL